jgi:hypothetical protein
VSTVTLNILLGVVCLGFLWFIWLGGLPAGPEGPVGAWIVPVPFLLMLLVAMIACIVLGRFDWVPGGKFVAFLLLTGFMIAVSAALFRTLERTGSAMDLVYRAIPLVVMAGCFASANRIEWAGGARIAAALILGLTAMSGFGLSAKTIARQLRQEMAASEEQAATDATERQERASREAAEFHALPQDAPLTAYIDFEFSADPQVERSAREKIANWPHLDDELSAILSSDTSGFMSQIGAITYIAEIHTAPPSRLAPAYAHLLDRAYQYWESTLRYNDVRRQVRTGAEFADARGGADSAGWRRPQTTTAHVVRATEAGSRFGRACCACESPERLGS